MAELGRPPVITDEVKLSLIESFSLGLSDREACLRAGIANSTLYEYCKENTDFAEQKEHLKDKPKMTAKLNIVRELEKGSTPISQWYLERRDKDFNPKSEVDLNGKLDTKVSLNDQQYEQLVRLAAKRLAGEDGSEEVV